MGAGYPSWDGLLHEIADEMGLGQANVLDLAALAQWHITARGKHRVKSVVREKIAVNKPIPAALNSIAHLPFQEIWTTNYDRLIERAFEEVRRPITPISSPKDLSLKVPSGSARLYKMHGSIENLDDIVLSTEDYELFKRDRGPYYPLLQASLTSKSVLFVGLSFSDPNLKHVFGSIKESFHDTPPEHYAILRRPSAREGEKADQFKARQAQHNFWVKDLQRYGLLSIEVDDYAEIDELLLHLRRSVARRKVWISGSFPLGGGEDSAEVAEFSIVLGKLIASEGKALVTGSGLTVGSASLSGFLDGLSPEESWDLNRRLVSRVFPQPVAGVSYQAHWKSIRQELAMESGIVLFIAGVKIVEGRSVMADGVLEEFDAALSQGSFLIPIGKFGGAASKIAERLRNSKVPFKGANAQRPTDDELVALSAEDLSIDTMREVVSGILRRLA